MPDAPGLELIAQELGSVSEGAVLSTYHEHGQACLVVDPEPIVGILRWLRDTPGQEYRFLSSLLERLPVFRVVLQPPVVSRPINARCCASEVYTSYSAELFDDLLARTL